MPPPLLLCAAGGRRSGVGRCGGVARRGSEPAGGKTGFSQAQSATRVGRAVCLVSLVSRVSTSPTMQKQDKKERASRKKVASWVCSLPITFNPSRIISIELGSGPCPFSGCSPTPGLLCAACFPSKTKYSSAQPLPTPLVSRDCPDNFKTVCAGL